MDSERLLLRAEVAARLRWLRQQSGIPISHLARMLSQSRPTYYDTEAGTRDVTPVELVALCKIFDVDVRWLLGLEAAPRPSFLNRGRPPETALRATSGDGRGERRG
jgi:transcriptional regulator with XRE-family HTH domain